MTQPLEKYAADADEVGAHNAEGREGDEDVEGAVGADLNEGKDDGDDGHEVGGVERDVPSRIAVFRPSALVSKNSSAQDLQLPNPLRPRQTFISRECPALTSTGSERRYVPQIHQDPEQDIEEKIQSLGFGPPE